MKHTFSNAFLISAMSFSFYAQANMCLDFYDELLLKPQVSHLKIHQERSGDAKRFMDAAMVELAGHQEIQSLKTKFKAIRLEAQKYNLSSADIQHLKKSMNEALNSAEIESWQAVDFGNAKAEINKSFKPAKKANGDTSKNFMNRAMIQISGTSDLINLKNIFKAIRLEAEDFNLSTADIQKLKKAMNEALNSIELESWQAVDYMKAKAEIGKLSKQESVKNSSDEAAVFITKALTQLEGNSDLKNLKNLFKAIRLEAQNYSLSAAEIQNLKNAMNETLNSAEIEAWQAVDFGAAKTEINASFKQAKKASGQTSKRFMSNALMQIEATSDLVNLKYLFKAIRLEAQKYSLSETDIQKLKKAMNETLNSAEIESWQAVDFGNAKAEIDASFTL